MAISHYCLNLIKLFNLLKEINNNKAEEQEPKCFQVKVINIK